MENLTPEVNNALLVLIYTSVVLFAVVMGFLVKLLYETTELAKKVRDSVLIINSELEPTLAEIKRLLENVNSVADNANKQVENLKQAVVGLKQPATKVVSTAKDFSVSFLKGLMTVIKTINNIKK